MKPSHLLAGLVVLFAYQLAFAQRPTCELAILNEKTWDEFVPKGKEVDAIYGDFVLRSRGIVAVIANPVPGRNANMTVKDVGGSIIDLTVRGQQSDQLSAYYPGRRAFPYRLARVAAEGNVGVDVPVSTNRDAVSFEAVDGKLEARFQKLSGDVIRLELVAPATADRPEVRLTYTLTDRMPYVEVRTEFVNRSDKPLTVLAADDFRADRTFQTAKPGETDLVWFYDKWWGQAYGIVSGRESPMRLTGSPAEPRAIEFLADGKPSFELAPGQSKAIVRGIFPASDLVGVKGYAPGVRAGLAQFRGAPGEPPVMGRIVTKRLQVKDTKGRPVSQADVELSQDGAFYGNARTDANGQLFLSLPVNIVAPTEPATATWQAKVSALGRGSKEFEITATASANFDRNIPTVPVELPAASRVVAEITNAVGKPIPCKVQFVGVEGTPNPYFFEDTGEHAVRNLYYSHNGRFTQDVPPGTYDVLVSYGPEYDMGKIRIEAKPGEDVPLRATLRQVVNSPGWISADFHSHSSPSGDNVSSQLGRVLNHLCENIEFAPCTEHNRLDTYVPHLRALGAEHLLGTCTGIELTSVPGTINHQNAFPLVMKPRVQDNGAPQNDVDPEVQIKRLALWDNGSEKLVQQNHPDIGEMFYDRDSSGKPDNGYKGMFAYQDVIEVHPIHDAINFNPLRYGFVEDKAKNTKTKYQYNNSIFNWLQLQNQGRRLPGVVNSDAHYNFHGTGYIRNYVKCQTDDPAKIDPLDIVHSAEKGHIIMTNGPYLDVTLYDSDAGAAAGGGERRSAIPGDDIALPGGFGTLHVRVQCPNWFDIDRVQVLLNGKPDPKLNWTRSANADAFLNDGGAVKFERKIPIEFKTDKHVIVIATGENSQIGSVMGPQFGEQHPTAISNPIFVDADGGGFKANGDTLGHPLPVKQQKPVP